MTDDGVVPRVSETIDDTTPLTASRIDVHARVGWLLRSHRAVAGISLRDMAAALRERGIALSASTLSRIESEGQLSHAALDGYARVLDLPEGTLWAPVEMMCHSFSYAPAVPERPVSASLDDFSRTCDAVGADAPTGGAWTEFAHQHRSGRYGLSTGLMEPYVRRLALEIPRAVGPARFTRHAALVALHTSAYGDLVGQVVRQVVEDPAAQNFWDLMDVAAHRPTPNLLMLAADLLRSDSTYRVLGATYGLQSMLVQGGLTLEEWGELVPHLHPAWEAAADDAVRRAALTQLGAALPPPLLERLRESCRLPPPPPPGPRTWSRTRDNVHYAFTTSVAGEVVRHRRQPEDPLLARLLFEAMFDPRGVRMSSATVLLACSPYAADVARVLVGQRDACPDESSRAAALRVAAFCHVDGDLAGAEALLDSPDNAGPDNAGLVAGLTMLSRSRRPLPQATVERGLGGDELTMRRTLTCLGLLGDERLGVLAGDPARPDDVRAAARWWLAQGPRVPA
jgi:hypothetical protein